MTEKTIKAGPKKYKKKKTKTNLQKLFSSKTGKDFQSSKVRPSDSKRLGGFAKGGDVFPDLSGDGKITQKDILMGRGVIKKSGGGDVKVYSDIQLSGRNFSGQY